VNKIKIGQKLSLVFGLLTCVSILVAAVVFVNLNGIRSASNWNDHTQEVLTQIDTIGAAMVDQETGVRGYLVSTDENFLAPYNNGGKAADAALDELKRLTSDNATSRSGSRACGRR